MGKGYIIINHKINRVIGFIYRPTKKEKQFLSTLCWTRGLEFSEIHDMLKLCGVRYSGRMKDIIHSSLNGSRG